MRRVLLLAALAGGLVMMACGGEDVGSPGSSAPFRPNVRPPSTDAGTVSGTVLQTMDSGGYTYVEVDSDGEKIWVACTTFPVQVGERVVFSQDMPMRDFRASSLDRTFDLIYFCNGIEVGGTRYGAPPHAARSEPPKANVHEGGATTAATPTEEPKFDYSGLKPPAGGKTVAEVFGSSEELAGKQVIVRGIVVKYTPNVMGKNWLHIRDGTGTTGTDDLTVTTSAAAKAGERVVIEGRVALKKDFGFGYKYPVLVEDATVRVEPVSQD